MNEIDFKKPAVLNLDKYDVFIEDDPNDPKFFDIKLLPEFLTYGKNTFIIGYKYNRYSKYNLRLGSEILSECKSENGYWIFHQYVKRSDNSGMVNGYIEIRENPQKPNLDKIIEISDDPTPEISDGFAYLTLMAELENVPDEWKNQYNVRLKIKIPVKKNFPNKSPVYFINEPVFSTSEILSKDKDNKVFERSFTQFKLDKLQTGGGLVKYVEIGYNAKSASTEDNKILDTFELTSSISSSEMLRDTISNVGIVGLTDTARALPGQSVQDLQTSHSQWIGDFTVANNETNWSLHGGISIATGMFGEGAINIGNTKSATKIFRYAHEDELYDISYKVSGSGRIQIRQSPIQTDLTQSFVNPTYVSDDDNLKTIYNQQFNDFDPNDNQTWTSSYNSGLDRNKIVSESIVKIKDEFLIRSGNFASIQLQGLTSTYNPGLNVNAISIQPKPRRGINTPSYIHRIELPNERRNDGYTYTLKFLNPNMDTAVDYRKNDTAVEISQSTYHSGSPFVLEKDDNVIYGGALKSPGYVGYYSASQGTGSGFMIYSGSVLGGGHGGTEYESDEVGLELAGGPESEGSGSLKFSTKTGKLEVTGSFQTTGDGIFGGTISASAGNIGGWNVATSSLYHSASAGTHQMILSGSKGTIHLLSGSDAQQVLQIASDIDEDSADPLASPGLLIEDGIVFIRHNSGSFPKGSKTGVNPFKQDGTRIKPGFLSLQNSSSEFTPDNVQIGSLGSILNIYSLNQQVSESGLITNTTHAVKIEKHDGYGYRGTGLKNYGIRVDVSATTGSSYGIYSKLVPSSEGDNDYGYNYGGYSGYFSGPFYQDEGKFELFGRGSDYGTNIVGEADYHFQIQSRPSTDSSYSVREIFRVDDVSGSSTDYWNTERAWPKVSIGHMENPTTYPSTTTLQLGTAQHDHNMPHLFLIKAEHTDNTIQFGNFQSDSGYVATSYVRASGSFVMGIEATASSGNPSYSFRMGHEINPASARKPLPAKSGSSIVITTGSLVGINESDPQESLHVDGNIRADGNIIANQYIVSSSVTYITSSFMSGSTKFGDSVDDTHVFTGSYMQMSSSAGTGLTVLGDISGSGTGSFSNIHLPNTTYIGSPADPQALQFGYNQLPAIMVNSHLYTSEPFNALNFIYLTDYMKHSGDTDTYLLFETDKITLTAGNLDMITMVENASTADKLLFGDAPTYFTGSITASRIISASNQITASAFHTPLGTGMLTSSIHAITASYAHNAGAGGGGGISFDGSTANGVLTYKDSDEATVESNLTFDGSSLTLTGDITASGHITASGNIITKHASYIGPIPGSTSLLFTGTPTANYESLWLHVGGNEILTYAEAGDVHPTIEFNGTRSDINFAVNSSGKYNAIFVNGATGNVGIGTEQAGSSFDPIPAKELTVSGSISASGEYYGDVGTGLIVSSSTLDTTVFNVKHPLSGSLFKVDADAGGGSLIVSGTLQTHYIESTGSAKVISVNDSINLTGNITASGNISASGTSHTLGGDLTIGDDLTVGDLLKVGRLTVNDDGSGANDFRVESVNKPYMLFNDANKDKIGIGFSSVSGNNLSSSLHISGGLTVNTNITASGDISASNTLYAENLSASGDYYAGDGINLGGVRRTTWPGTGTGGTSLWYNNTHQQTSSMNVLVDGAITSSVNLIISGGASSILEYRLSNLSSVTNGGTGRRLGFAISSGSDVGGAIINMSGSSEGGFVGIGTSYLDKMDHALTVEGNISASGFIHAISHITSSGNILAQSEDARIRVDATAGNHPGYEWLEAESRKWIIFNDPANDHMTWKNAQGSDTELMELDQDGYLYVNSRIVHLGDTDTFIDFTADDINIQAGGVNMMDFTQNDASQDEITFNEGHADLDVRIEGDTDTDLFFTNAGTDRVGVGTNSPSSKLQVDGDFTATNITASGNISASGTSHVIAGLINLGTANSYIRYDSTFGTHLKSGNSIVTLTGNTNVGGHITASGHISSSGAIYASSYDGYHGNDSYIACTPVEFVQITDQTHFSRGYTTQIEEDGSEAKVTNAAVDFVCIKMIPKGFKATGIIVYGDNWASLNQLTVNEGDITNDTVSSVLSANTIGSVHSFSSEVEGTGTEYIAINVNPTLTSQTIHGAKIFISRT